MKFHVILFHIYVYCYGNAHTVISHGQCMFSRFPRNSEVFAFLADSLQIFHRYYMHSNVYM